MGYATTGVRTAQALFRTVVDPYDVMADGRKFAINSCGERNVPLTVLVNGMARLKKQ
jgi:hypothetical protein